jgi:hypothetical protein
MRDVNKSLKSGMIAAVLAASTLVTTGTVASADVVCNSYGECWNTSQRYGITIYPPELGIQFYGDDWRESHRDDPKYKWMKDRDDDHGYYSHGEWHEFKS